MAARKPRTPSYRLHKSSGQAVVTLSGKDHYLGRHGSDASHAAYRRVIAEWFASQGENATATQQGQGDSGVTIGSLILRYHKWALEFYVKGGKPTSEIDCIKGAMRPLCLLYKDLPVNQFGPLKLEAVQQDLVASNFCRNVVNSRVQRIVRMFRWGMGKELVPPGVYTALKGVMSLRRGQNGVRESNPVKPVADASVNAVQPHVPRQVWAMIELQRLTGMRPGEVCSMRTGDIDRSIKTWIYVPGSHKTEHHGKARIIFLGPKAQAVLTPWLRDKPDEFLFSPKDSMEAIWKTNTGRRKREPKRVPGGRYSRMSYYNAIACACVKAGVEHWHPNQLRHNAATMLRKEFGLDVARAVLGHSSPTTTEIYAERDSSLARDAAEKIG